MLRIVHYLNQFFGGIGGEEKAESGPQIHDGPLGPGRAIQAALGDRAQIVATVTCGDNYFAENIEKASGEVITLIRPHRPDLLIAGPAFSAGRYGIACGAVCQAAITKLGISAVTGMHEENPGVDLYRHDVYIVSTESSVKGMKEAVSRMVSLALKLAYKQKIGRPSEEAYLPRGWLTNEISNQTGAERVVSMLLKKLKGQPFETEVPRPVYDRVPPAPGIKDICRARIALVTDGGLVLKGNPDKIESRTATRFGKYSFRGMDSLRREDYEVSHVGYDSVFIREDPNRLVPVDVMRDLERARVIGTLHEVFYTTAGVANVVETMIRIGKQIAAELKAESVSGVILTST
jgi:betaine reductase